MTARVRSSASLYLDNVETSKGAEKSVKHLKNKAFRQFAMYSELLELSDYEKYKKQSVRIAGVLQNDEYLKERGELIEHCGDFLSFGNEGNLLSANFCRQRLCPNCQRRKALRTYAKISELARELKAQGFEFIHLVLTVRNCSEDEFPATIDELFKKSSKFFTQNEVKRVFKGALRCLEVTYSHRRKDFHPHLHCMVAVKKSYFTSRYYLAHPKIVELWQKALGVDYVPEVSVGKINENGLAEVAKYCVKPLDLCAMPTAETLCVLRALHRSLHGRRLTQSYGVIRATLSRLKIDLEADELQVDKTDLTEKMRRYVYNFKLKKYEPYKTAKKSEFTFSGK